VRPLIITGLVVLALSFAKAIVEVAGVDPYAGHVLFVPVVSALILWHRRDAFRATKGEGHPLAFVLFGAAVVLLMLAHSTSSYLAHTLSVVLALAGATLWFGGTVWLRQAAFPLGFLLCMLPLPASLVAAASPPVRSIVAGFAAGAVALLQVPVEHQGFVLRLPNASVIVDDTCNGLRFLLVLFVIATAFAELLIETPSRKVLLVIGAIPAAVLANAIRVTEVTMAAYLYGAPAAASLHDYLGRGTWLLTIAALLVWAMLLGQPARQGWFLRWADTPQPKKA
jgi:exosortase